MKYSKELVLECTKVFTEENDHRINKETAEEYLDGLSGLFLAFSKDSKDEKGVE